MEKMHGKNEHKNLESQEGGYMKDLQLPGVVLEHEQQQRKLLDLHLDEPKQTVTSSSSVHANINYNPYKRRKGSKKSYWDLSTTESPT